MAQLKVLVFLMLSVYEAKSLCANSGMSWLPNPLNCNQFYLCLNGEKVPYSCPVGLVAEVNSKTCVPKRSALDHCKYMYEKNCCLIISDICSKLSSVRLVMTKSYG